MFYESDVEKMVIETIVNNGWKYVPAEELPRSQADVMVETMVRDALVRLNPEIAEKPEYWKPLEALCIGSILEWGL